MGPQRRMGIYVGYESPSTLKYLEPITGDLFTAHFADCHFDESNFPALGERIRSWKKRSLKNLANQLPNAFTDPKGVTKSYIPAANAPIKIDIPVGQSNESQPRLKRCRPIGSKDKIPRTRKGAKNKDDPSEDIENPSDIINISSLEEIDQVLETHENKEISINYVQNGIQWNRNEVDIDDLFAYIIALNEINEKEDHEPASIKICRQSEDWPKWKDAIEAELNSLYKRQVFGPVVRTPEGVKPVGYIWVFVRKQNEKGEIVRYKAQLVAQGFSQRPGIDFDETYSPVMDASTF
ncbi:uncharacterized protein LOC131641850 [Vicia villosa]|uniref:uncharacterized protein LOC131641850 n=1 Tax=Vicia villosa TaxID=3911 RepID=UPI00273B054C|nr:uncharacterized protein LOC131641850 [Vicia villosa]